MTPTLAFLARSRSAASVLANGKDSRESHDRHRRINSTNFRVYFWRTSNMDDLNTGTNFRLYFYELQTLMTWRSNTILRLYFGQLQIQKTWRINTTFSFKTWTINTNLTKLLQLRPTITTATTTTTAMSTTSTTYNFYQWILLLVTDYYNLYSYNYATMLEWRCRPSPSYPESPLCPRSASASPLAPCFHRQLHRCSQRWGVTASSPDIAPRRHSSTPVRQAARGHTH